MRKLNQIVHNYAILLYSEISFLTFYLLFVSNLYYLCN